MLFFCFEKFRAFWLQGFTFTNSVSDGKCSSIIEYGFVLFEGTLYNLTIDFWAEHVHDLEAMWSFGGKMHYPSHHLHRGWPYCTFWGHFWAIYCQGWRPAYGHNALMRPINHIKTHSHWLLLLLKVYESFVLVLKIFSRWIQNSVLIRHRDKSLN